MKLNYGRDVWFDPKPDITFDELVQILRHTVFKAKGSEFGGAYQCLPPDLRKHFRLDEPSE